MNDTTIQIPDPIYLDYPLSVMLRLFADGTVNIHPHGINPLFGTTPVSLPELANISQQLQKAIAYLTYSNKDAAQLGSTQLSSDLQSLAELGNYAYRRLFPDPDAQSLFQSLPPGSTIEVVSENFTVPWQLLYDGDITQPILLTNFWGIKHIISHILIGKHHRRGPVVAPYINTPAAPRIGLLTYNQLPAVATHEIPFFQTLNDSNHICLLKLRALDRDNKQTELQAFTNFWQDDDPFHIAHFACHAIYDSSGPNRSELTLSNDFPITFQDLVIHNFKIEGHPLVILNACETNTLNALYSSHFAAWFLELGARGVVVTEAKIPDAFAADFARELYGHLLNGTPIGTSLLKTRQHMWQTHNNPSGLAYAMYGPSAIHLKKETPHE